jgi:prolyl 4-hydroxylase
MFTYLLALVPILLFFSDPISQLFSSSPPKLRRLPRPQLNEELLALEDATLNYTCPDSSYTVHVFSRAPLVLYIENFLSASERHHILEIRYVHTHFLILPLPTDHPRFNRTRPP